MLPITNNDNTKKYSWKATRYQNTIQAEG